MEPRNHVAWLVILGVVALTLVGVGRPVQAQTQTGTSDLFMFIINPWDVAPDNITNVSHWLDRPAGRDGFIRAEGGRFVTPAGDPIRFLGVNLSYGANFPTHQQAHRLAERLARFGINLVRFHHMDRYEAPEGIWRAGVYPREIDPVMLDQLDYFVAKLKEQGIYSNFNLKVARTLQPQEGFPGLDERPTYDKGLDLFHPEIVAEHKRIFEQLLTHVNPYTGNPYVNEPALAQIELTNEDGMFYVWQRGELDASPQHYLESLDDLWGEWLREKYGTTQALRRAWGGAGTLSGDGVERVENGDFRNGTEGWLLQTDSISAATYEVVEGAGPVLSDGTQLPALKLSIEKQGADAWIPQFMRAGIDMQPGQTYRVSFWVRVEGPLKELRVNTMLAGPPYTSLWGDSIRASSDWQQFEFDFRVPESTPPGPSRVTFTRLLSDHTYWIAGVSVQRTTEKDGLGLPDGESLEAGVSRPTYADLVRRTGAVQQDYVQFLLDTDKAYFDDLYRYIKEDLGARSLVAGTQVPLSPPSVQAGLDYVDVHFYFKHPQFPGGGWDGNNWYIENVSMVNSDGGTIPSLAGLRVAGKPYVVSEYNHPAPNTYSSEGFLLAGAYGAYQDWSGLVAFDWSLSRDFDSVQLTNYFNIKAHSTKLVTLPAVSALFVRGDVEVGAELANVLGADALSLYSERAQTSVNHAAWSRDVPRTASLEQRIARVVEGIDPAEQGGEKAKAPTGPVYTSDTGQLVWDRTKRQRSLVTIDTELSKAAIGYGAGRTVSFDGGVTLKPGNTRQDGWSAITMTLMEGDAWDDTARVLVTATGYIQNTGMVWEELESGRSTLRNRWGSAPVLVEGIPAEIELPVPAERVTVYALDMIGNRQREVPVQPNGDHAVVEIGPTFRTLWYEVVID